MYSENNDLLRNTVFGVFRAYVLRKTASTRSIARFSTAGTSGHAIFRGSILWILFVLQLFQGFVLRVLHVLAAFRLLVVRELGIL